MNTRNFIYPVILLITFIPLSIQAAEEEKFEPFKMVLVHGGEALPIGSFNDIFDPTFTLGGGILYGYTSSISFEANFFFSSYSAEIDEFDPETGMYTGEKVEIDHRIYDVTAGIRYFIVDWYVSPYAAIGAGLYTNSNDDSETDFGLNMGGGVRFRITDRISADLNIRYNNIFTERADTKYLTITAGPAILF